jgi:tripartite-type tricarboxylate transporter receptor subunit TctC
MFDGVPNSIDYIRAGTLRALAVTIATRSEAPPDLPTVGDSCQATRRARLCDLPSEARSDPSIKIVEASARILR